MPQFVIMKNRKFVRIVDNAAEARDLILEDLQKTPRATYEVSRLIRRIRADRVPPRFTTVEEDLDP